MYLVTFKFQRASWIQIKKWKHVPMVLKCKLHPQNPGLESGHLDVRLISDIYVQVSSPQATPRLEN